MSETSELFIKTQGLGDAPRMKGNTHKANRQGPQPDSPINRRRGKELPTGSRRMGLAKYPLSLVVAPPRMEIISGIQRQGTLQYLNTKMNSSSSGGKHNSNTTTATTIATATNAINAPFYGFGTNLHQGEGPSKWSKLGPF